VNLDILFKIIILSGIKHFILSLILAGNMGFTQIKNQHLFLMIILKVLVYSTILFLD